jgi:cell division protein FtsB
MSKKSKKKRAQTNLGRWIIAAGLGLLVIFFIQGDFGLYTKLTLLKRKYDLEKQIQREQEKQAYLEEKIQKLESDENAVERQVREDFGMGREDEVIIKFETEQNKKQKHHPPDSLK